MPIIFRKWGWIGIAAMIGCVLVFWLQNRGLRALLRNPELMQEPLWGSEDRENLSPMLRRLRELADQARPELYDFLNEQRVERARLQLRKVKNPDEPIKHRLELASELLKSGRTEEGIQYLANARQLAQNSGNQHDTPTGFPFDLLQATAYLRLGEQENCLHSHNTDSCLLPISGHGIHLNPRGSRGAIPFLLNALDRNPKDLRAVWLLNLTYMTLGEYPDQVPQSWLIPPRSFASDFDIKRFRNVAPAVGLDAFGRAGGSIMEDFDGDGLLDIMTSSCGLRDPLRYFRNKGDGQFQEQTHEAGLTGQWGGLNLIHADYNNDGHPDVLVLRGGWFVPGFHPNSLLRNDGGARFTDVTEEVGILSFHPTQTAVWLDYDNDGWIDLFIGNENTEADLHPCELYRNNGDGTFSECAAAVGTAVLGFVKGVTAGDIDNDGLTDLYISRLGQHNLLLRNEGPEKGSQNDAGAWRFSDVTTAAGVAEPIHSFPTWFWDYDNDGWLDLFVAGYQIENVGDIAADYLGIAHAAARARLYRNLGDGTFSDITQDVNLDRVLYAMGCNYGDLDSDGFLDFYVGTGEPDLSSIMPNRMFRNQEGKVFQDVTTSGGFGHLQKGHAVSFGDIDNDGDQDIYQNIGGWYSGDTYWNALFENPGHGHHWISLKLEGRKSNRAAIGARIKVTVQTVAGSRIIWRTVGTGGSFGGSPLRQEIGLGHAYALEAVEIIWPASGARHFVDGLRINSNYRIREKVVQSQEVTLKRFKLLSGSNHHHN